MCFHPIQFVNSPKLTPEFKEIVNYTGTALVVVGVTAAVALIAKSIFGALGISFGATVGCLAVPILIGVVAVGTLGLSLWIILQIIRGERLLKNELD